MHIEILEEAQEDILKGVLFYESQQYGAGDYFLDTISADINSLHLYAGIHIQIKNYYRIVSKRFPYSIYYKIDNNLVKIYAVLDDRSDPKMIESRLEEEK